MYFPFCTHDDQHGADDGHGDHDDADVNHYDTDGAANDHDDDIDDAGGDDGEGHGADREEEDRAAVHGVFVVIGGFIGEGPVDDFGLADGYTAHYTDHECQHHRQK